MQWRKVNSARLLQSCSVLALAIPIVFSSIGAAQAEQPPPRATPIQMLHRIALPSQSVATWSKCPSP